MPTYRTLFTRLHPDALWAGGFHQEMYFILQPMGQEHAILALGLLVGQLLILIFGPYYVISAFYFSRDLDMLIPLPVRPSEVLVSKFVVLLVNEYMTVACIVLPFVITFGILDKGGIGYWVSATLVYMALPVIPLVIVSLIVVPMMRFINISRKKDILILVGSVAVLAAAFSFQFLAQKAQHESLNATQMGCVPHFTRQSAPQDWIGFSTEHLGSQGRCRRFFSRRPDKSCGVSGRIPDCIRGADCAGRKTVLSGRDRPQ